MRVDRVTRRELEHGLQSLYADVAREPVPAALAEVLNQIGEVKPGAPMGGREAPGVLMPGGQSSAA